MWLLLWKWTLKWKILFRVSTTNVHQTIMVCCLVKKSLENQMVFWTLHLTQWIMVIFTFIVMNFWKLFLVKLKFPIKEKRVITELPIFNWQPFDFYILCFVDVDDNFTPRYYLVPKNIITQKGYLRLTSMNGTIHSNKDNKNVSKSVTIKGDDCDWFFKKHSLLKGNTFSDLKQFFNKDFIKTNKTKIIKSLNF